MTLTIANTQRKLKRFFTIFIIALFTLNIAPSLIQNVQAAPYAGNNGDLAQAEYIQWHSYRVIQTCMSGYTGIGANGEQDLINGIFSASIKANSGMVFNRYISTKDTDAEIDCNTKEDIYPLLTALGFDGIRDFVDKIKKAVEKPDATSLSKTEFTAGLDRYIRNNKLAGKGATTSDLSEAALYWYWNEVYRTSKTDAESAADGNFASCAGILSNDATKSRTTQISNGPFYYVGAADGAFKTEEYTYAYYDQDTGRKISPLANAITIDGTSSPTCQQIAKHGITKARADAYAASLNSQVEAGVTPTPSAGGQNPAGGGDDDKAMCETAGSPSGWIICPFYNMFAETTAFFYKSILQPFLYTAPINITPNNNPTFTAWSNFRFYANMFLVIAMIIIVFGQSIGGGLIDAYTAKKVMPRVLTAAILINISIYIVAILVDVSNALGNGISALIMAPFDTNFQVGPSTAIAGVLGMLIAGGVGAASIAGFVGAAVGGGLSSVFMTLLMTVAVPLALALLGVFVTLVIRKGLITILVLISPVAFALYCLPNTEKYFKKWWDLLVKALLVYPIVMAIFAVSNVLSLTIMQQSSGQANGLWTDFSTWSVQDGIAGLVALFVQIIPLFMVPFAFKFAGGAMASLYAAVEGGGKKAGGLLKNRQEVAKKDYQTQALQARQKQYDKLGAWGDKSRFGRRGARFLQNRVGGYNLHGALAEMSAEQFKEMDAQKSTGIDDEQRALTVNKSWALANDATGGTHWRTGKNGGREFRTLGGRWVSESSVDAAHNRWGGSMAAMQWSVGYEMAKAATQEEQEYLFNNYGRLGSTGSGLNLSDGQMSGMWTGAAFAQQNSDRQYKHYGWSSDNGGGLRVSGVAMMREIDERQGNWQMMSQSADTWTTMSQEVARARRIVANPGMVGTREAGDMSVDDAKEVLQRSSRIAKSLGGGYRTEDGRWVDTGVGQGASGRTKEEIENFVALFDVEKQGRNDYQREVGMERRGKQNNRSGDTYVEPVFNAGTGKYEDRPASTVEASGFRTEIPQSIDPDVNQSRSNPRGS